MDGWLKIPLPERLHMRSELVRRRGQLIGIPLKRMNNQV